MAETMKFEDIARAFKELVGAAECDGWDLTANKDVLNAGREACAQLEDSAKGAMVMVNVAGRRIVRLEGALREVRDRLDALAVSVKGEPNWAMQLCAQIDALDLPMGPSILLSVGDHSPERLAS